MFISCRRADKQDIVPGKSHRKQAATRGRVLYHPGDHGLVIECSSPSYPESVPGDHKNNYPQRTTDRSMRFRSSGGMREGNCEHPNTTSGNNDL